MENEIITYFCWFIGGALSYKALSYIFALGTSLNLLNQALTGAISILYKIDQQKIIAMAEHHKKLEETSPQEEIEKIKQEDIRAHSLWREMMIAIIIANCPKSFHSSLRFNDWNTATKLLNKRR